MHSVHQKFSLSVVGLYIFQTLW